EGITNIRIGMFLEVATTLGAIAGAFLIAYLPTSLISIVFGFILIFSAFQSSRKKVPHDGIRENSRWADKLKLGGSFPDKGIEKKYTVKNVFGGFLMMGVAGILSGLLGIG